MTTKEALERITVCANYNLKLYQTADPNNVHWYHEGTGDVRCPTRFAKPVPAPIVALEVDEKCLLCGHAMVDSNGVCIVEVHACSDESHNHWRKCGCKCRFRDPAPASTVAPQQSGDGDTINRSDAIRILQDARFSGSYDLRGLIAEMKGLPNVSK